MGKPGLVLVELSVVEQRYRAVLAVQAGEPAVHMAAQLGGVASDGAELAALLP